MKYIDTDKLIAEIERRIAAYQKNFDKADNKIAKLSTDGRIASLKGILPFITSLQQEQPEVECDDLEEVARAYSEQVTDGHNYRDLTCGFKAGAKWQKEQMMKDAVDIKVIESYNPTCEPNERLHGISFIYDCKNDNQYLIAGDRAKIIIVKEEE